MDFSTKLSLPYLLPNQAQKHVTVNESLRALDALVQLSVLSMNETVPPTNPNDGDRYIPAAESEGEWLAQEGMIACFQDGVWRFYQPQAGWMAWVELAQSFWVFDGSDWQASGGQAPADKLGVNTSADAYNRFALRAPASLFDNEGAGHQLKINKASEAETASMLFQTGYTGHAEMGLAGNNNFNVKVSADGQSFSNALLVRADNGNVGIGTYWPTAKLHVNGALRIGGMFWDELPSPASAGAGMMTMARYADQSKKLVFCDGEHWQVVTFQPIQEGSE